jgi:hypothetical protein
MTDCWKVFYQGVKRSSVFQERLEMLSTAKSHFENTPHYSQMPDSVRGLIAGIHNTYNDEFGTNPNWEVFGTMFAAGTFAGAINANNQHISNALDAIPLTGNVTEQNYNDYRAELLLGFPNGGCAIATVTRLLAMKRPDVFLCVNGENTATLRDVFAIPAVDLNNYWQNVILRIQASHWWQTSEDDVLNASNEELLTWKGRAAMFDVLVHQ